MSLASASAARCPAAKKSISTLESDVRAPSHVASSLSTPTMATSCGTESLATAHADKTSVATWSFAANTPAGPPRPLSHFASAAMHSGSFSPRRAVSKNVGLNPCCSRMSENASRRRSLHVALLSHPT